MPSLLDVRAVIDSTGKLLTSTRGGEEFLSDGGEAVGGRGALLEPKLLVPGFEIPASDSAVE